MAQQSYKNHIRFYPPHHFVFYPLLAAAVGCCIYGMAKSYYWQLFAVIGSLLVFIGWLSFMTRQHYALTLQNRLVRLEMRVRYHQLTGQRLEIYEDRLSFGQIAALRFASDGELPALLERTLNEHLSPDAIKKSIRSWQADDMRV